jgi:sugar phosphate isomerase/epimerase
MQEDPEATLSQLGEMGYKFIEAAGYSDGKFYGMEPEEFKELVESNGMDFLSSHVMLAIEDLDHEQVMEWWDQCIQAHSKAGVKYIVQAAMGSAAVQDMEVLNRYIRMFNNVGRMAREEGMLFGFHNHAVEFETIDGTVVLQHMIENTDPELVFFQPDLYWFYKGGANPLEYFEKYPGRFEVWHVKDYAELGQSGEIDFEKIFTQDQSSGRKFIVVEVEEYNFDPLVSVEISLDYLLNADFI